MFEILFVFQNKYFYTQKIINEEDALLTFICRCLPLYKNRMPILKY